jgi:hypothetical protein
MFIIYGRGGLVNGRGEGQTKFYPYKYGVQKSFNLEKGGGGGKKVFELKYHV